MGSDDGRGDWHPIQTEWDGCKFRSRLEARLAVAITMMGIDWEYEPEGYEHDGELPYLPDFLLHGVRAVIGSEEIDMDAGGGLWVETKGRMSDEDARKITEFAVGGHSNVLVVGRIPWGKSFSELLDDVTNRKDDCFWVDGTDGRWHLGALVVGSDGRPRLVDAGKCHRWPSNEAREATREAYKIARMARFEYGEAPEPYMLTVVNRLRRDHGDGSEH